MQKTFILKKHGHTETELK